MNFLFSIFILSNFIANLFVESVDNFIAKNKFATKIVHGGCEIDKL